MTSAYCREVCHGKRCDICPAPGLLPDAQPGVAAYTSVSTQWRHGYGGITGLDYVACNTRLRQLLPRWRRESPTVFGGLKVAHLMDDVQVIEAAVLGAKHERDEADEAKRNAEHTH